MGIIHLDHPSSGSDPPAHGRRAEIKCRGFILDSKNNEVSICNTPITSNDSLIQRNFDGQGNIYCTIFNFVLGNYTLPTVMYDDHDRSRRWAAIIRHIYCRKCMSHIGCKFVRIVNKRHLYKSNCFLIDDIMVY